MLRTIPVLLGVVLFLTGAVPAHAEVARADCAAFVLVGAPGSVQGATWTYRSTDEGVRYALEGVLFTPAGAGPHPAVVVSHGKNGNAGAYSARVARTMVGWGLVAIAANYTHAADAHDLGNAPDGPDGASEANVQRAEKTRQLLACVGGVDLSRVAAHGNSMGAFVTGQLLGTHPTSFRAASHTSGGVGDEPYATDTDVAARITTPYQLHHGDADTVVPVSLGRALARVLAANDAPHVLHVYPGYDHQEMAQDSQMFSRVRSWYRAHGVL